MIRLFTSFYAESSEPRRAEILECLRRNLSVPEIDTIHLLLENVDQPVSDSRLSSRQTTKRPQYRDFFDWARELCTGNDDVSIICNSDIYFDSGVAALEDRLNLNQCAALTRWDVQPDGRCRLFNRNDTQDTWVFRGKIRQVVDDYPIGVPRCDNRMLYELQQAGYDVINPSLSVRSFHLHAGSRPEYQQDNLKNFVDPPYAYLWPHNLCSLMTTTLHNLRHRDHPLHWRPDWKRLGQTIPARVLRKLTSRAAGAQK